MQIWQSPPACPHQQRYRNHCLFNAFDQHGMSLDKAAQESLVRFVAGKRSAYLKGYEWAFSELIETKDETQTT
eukprot:3111728-Amphidinium_carterae.1